MTLHGVAFPEGHRAITTRAPHHQLAVISRVTQAGAPARDDRLIVGWLNNGRGAEDANGTPTYDRISPSILVYENDTSIACLRSRAGYRSGGKGEERDGVSSSLVGGSDNSRRREGAFLLKYTKMTRLRPARDKPRLGVVH